MKNSIKHFKDNTIEMFYIKNKRDILNVKRLYYKQKLKKQNNKKNIEYKNQKFLSYVKINIILEFKIDKEFICSLYV